LLFCLTFNIAGSQSNTVSILCDESIKISRIHMDASNKRNIKIIIVIVAASIIARILIYYIIPK
jgi:hypothetical protein